MNDTAAEDKSKKAKASRSKGKRGEREVVNILKLYGFQAKRGWQTRADVKEPDVITDLPFWLEVKNQEKLNIKGAIKQAESDNSSNNPSCVVFKAAAGRWYAAVTLPDLIKLCIQTYVHKL